MVKQIGPRSCSSVSAVVDIQLIAQSLPDYTVREYLINQATVATRVLLNGLLSMSDMAVLRTTYLQHHISQPPTPFLPHCVRNWPSDVQNDCASKRITEVAMTLIVDSDKLATINYLNNMAPRPTVHYAVYNNLHYLLDALCKSCPKQINQLWNGRTPLHRSCRSDLECAKILLSQPEIEVNVAGELGRTPLLCAAEAGNRELFKLLLEDEKVNANLAEEDGWTALHWAARNNWAEFVEVLIGRGLDANLKDDNDWTPLRLAQICDNNNKLITALSSHRGDSTNGQTALRLGCTDASASIITPQDGGGNLSKFPPPTADLEDVWAFLKVSVDNIMTKGTNLLILYRFLPHFGPLCSVFSRIPHRGFRAEHQQRMVSYVVAR